MTRFAEYPCTTSDTFCSDPSRRVQVHRRQDVQGNASGGFVLVEGGRYEAAFFEQRDLRSFVEDLAAVAGGSVTWGIMQ